MKGLKSLLIGLALLAPSAAFAQAPAAPSPDYSRLWTGWSRINRESMTSESQAADRVRQDLATADAERLRVLQNQGRALGERVGEIVRLGDCAEGERVARQAGDFALVEAVRSHCARTSAPQSEAR